MNNLKIKYHARALKSAVVVSVVFAVMVFVGVMLSSSFAKAIDEVSDSLNLSLPMTCELVNKSGVYSATLTSGTVKEIEATNFKARCNDTGGFALYAVGYSSDTEGNTDLVSSVSSSYNIVTGTATSGNTSNWAMKVTPVSGISAVGGFNAYHAVPSSYTRVAEKASGIIPGEFSVASSTYQVYPTVSQNTGGYVGKIKYTLVHPSTESCPEGYSLQSGECKVAPTLYMQDVATWGDTLTTEQSTQAVDQRDNKTYWVTKLADGNIWMTQNLDLDLNASTLPLTSDTSDVSADWNPGSTYYTKTIISYSEEQTDMYSWSLGDYVYDGVTNSDCGESATSYADCTDYGFSLATSLAADSTQRHYHVGNNYQWNAATAGTGGTITSGQATDSICPKGWRLPTSKNGGEFQVLSNTYGVTSGTGTSGTVQTLINSPLYFVRGGDANLGVLKYAGNRGLYWSSTPYSDKLYAYYLRFYGTSDVYPSYYGTRYLGMGVRCIADY